MDMSRAMVISSPMYSLREREIKHMVENAFRRASVGDLWNDEDFSSTTADPFDDRDQGVRKVPWLVELRAFCSDASVVGLRYVANVSASPFRRLIWTLLLLAGAGFTTFQIQDRIRYYTSYPESFNIRVEHEKELRFPTVTICNENIARRSAADALGMTEMLMTLFPPFPIPGFTPNLTAFDFNRNMSWYDIYLYLAQPLQEALAMCQYNSEWCSYDAFETVATNMGFCFSFNPANVSYTSRQTGSSRGLLLMLNIAQSDYLLASSSSAGFRVLLHDPSEKPQMLERGFKVSPGFLTQVAVTARYMVDLPSPFGDCEPSEDYVQSKCLAECEANYLISNCNCKDVSMLGDAPICDPKTYYQCVAITKWQYIKDNEAAKCNCPRQCRRLTYQYSISQAQLSTFVVNFAKTVFQLNETVDEIRGDHCSLEVFFSELKNTYIETEEAYSLLALMCDIGGALGLILGSTLLTFCEFADLLITLLISWTRVRTTVDVTLKN